MRFSPPTIHPDKIPRLRPRVPETSNETGNNLPLLIHHLAEKDLARRTAAAAEIFRRGCDVARSATKGWFADSELASCFVLDASHFPQATLGVAVEPATFERIRAACGSPHLADVPPDQDATEFELEFPGEI